MAQVERDVAARPGPEAGFERPNLDSDFVEPETEIERQLAAFWAELLGISEIGVEDNFFDLGGHSLIAVRLFAKVKAAYAVDFPISILFEAPTIPSPISPPPKTSNCRASPTPAEIQSHVLAVFALCTADA